ncbi:uncharacterized protein LOC128552016 [Mercenaria mercenaria]|uniref:uncharacterized protein LOC128552016 n=1 Tax=Mercenaria mercenaria TaxID=6596 RepID=UPI00234F1436|nr:uncharacterized protein LOC128552016 [Mercenaria mercenaria]
MENENMVNAAIEDFRCSIERIQLPVLKPKEFEDIYNELKQVSLSHFRQGMVKVSAIHKTRAIDEVEIIWKAKSDENRALVRNYYQESLKNMYDRTVGKNLASKKYSTDGGNESYKRDMNAMIVNYLLETEGSWDNEIKYVLTVFLEHESANEREVERMSEDRRKDKLFKVNEALKRIDNDLKNILETVTKHTWSYFKKTEADIHDYLQKQENMMHELQTAIRTNDAILRTLKEENQKLKEECEYLFEQARQEVDLLNLKLEG